MEKIKPEILAPAENIKQLKLAIDCGADAVYIGGKKLNLTVFSGGFTNEQLIEGIRYCHERNKKIYVTLNAFVRNKDLKDAGEYIKELGIMGIDAVLIADGSLISIIKENAPDINIHLSTQANTVNSVSAKFWYEHNIKRITLSRELTLEEIKGITANLPEGCEVEAFVHGSMCIAYSARSLISNYIFGHDKERNNTENLNVSEYYLVEETRPGQYYPVFEAENGTYIFNNKDLCMIHHIPELVKSGITAFKIAGRMINEEYIKSVVKVYREALDSYYENPDNYLFKNEWMDKLKKADSKQYHTGFYIGRTKEENY